MEYVSFRLSEAFQPTAAYVVEEIATFVHGAFRDAEVSDMGATAIPGLLTKGDVDVNVRVDRSEFLSVVEFLRQHFGVHQLQNWTDGYASFASDDRYPLPVGVQVTVRGHPDDKFLAQRDRLAKQPHLIEQYNSLKRRYEGALMDEYRRAKCAFIAEHLDR